MDVAMAMDQAHWRGSNGEAPEVALAVSASWRFRNDEAMSASDAATANALEQLGLDPGEQVRVHVVVHKPERAYDPEAAGAYGGAVEFKVEIVNAEHQTIAHAHTGKLKRVGDPDQRNVTMPWPISELEGNVFADRTGNTYAVRPHLIPRAGGHHDEIPVTASQTPETGSGVEREIGILPRNGTRGARLVLRCEGPGEQPRGVPEDIKEITLQIWPAQRPGSAKTEPWTIRGYEAIAERIERARQTRDVDEERGLDAGFVINRGSSTEADLEALYERCGLGPRPAGDGMLRTNDLRAITLRLIDPEPPQREEGVRSFARQIIVTGIDSAREALRRATRATTERALGLATGRNEVVGENEVTIRVDPETGAEGNEHRKTIAERIAQSLANEHGVTRVERELTAWRQNARAVQIPHGCSRAERDSIRRTVLQTAHRMSRHPDDVTTAVDLTPAPMSNLFVDLTSVSHNTRPGKAASTHGASSTVSNADGRRMPAIRMEQIADGEAVDVPLNELVGETIEVVTAHGPQQLAGERPAGERARAPRYRIPDAAVLDGAMLRELPLNSLADATRVSMAVSMGEAALAPTEGLNEPLVRGSDVRGNTIEPSLPTHRMFVAAYDGDPRLFEDGVMISASAAQRISLRLPHTITLQRHRIGETDRVYVGGEAANFEDAKAALPELTREAFEKLDLDGVVRKNTMVEPGDVIQLYRTETVNAATGETELSYGASWAPSHGHRLVTSVEIEDNTERSRREPDAGASPTDIGEAGWNGSIEEEQDWETGEQTVRIRTIEDTGIDSGFKVTSLGATKGMMTVCPDDQMPCTEDGEPVDIAISGYSMSSRMAPSDMVELRLGHLVQNRTRRIETTLSELAEGRGEWNDALATYARTLTGNDEGGARTSIAEAIGVANGVPDARSAQKALEKLRKMSGSDGKPGAVGITVPHWPTRADIKEITDSLDYETNEECVVAYANGADREAGRRLHTPAMAGMCGVLMLRHLGRKSERLAPLTRTNDGVHPITGQRRDSRRIGMMETDAWLSAGAITATGEMHALSDDDARKNAVKHLEKGLPLLGNEDWGEQRIERTIDHWLECLGLANVIEGSGNRRWRPQSDDERRSQSDERLSELALEPSHDTDGNTIAGGLADGPGNGPLRFRHIELPVPIVHPMALERGPGENGPVIGTLLGINARELANLARRDNAPKVRNGPDRIKSELEAIEKTVATDPERGKRSAQSLCPENPDELVKIVDAMVVDPALRPSNWVIETVAIPDARLRPARRMGPSAIGSSPHRIDNDIRTILNVIRDTRRHPEDSNTAQRISRAVARYVNRIHTITFGKKALLNRAAESPRVGVSISGAILPGDPETLGAHHVGVSARSALTLCEHIAVPALAESEGIDPAMARSRLENIDWKRVEAGDPPTVRAWETLRRSSALQPVLVSRSPALHMHAGEAMETRIRDETEGGAIRPKEDNTIVLPPHICEGQNADFDGDQVAGYGVVSAAAAEDARRQSNPGRHIHRVGDGAPQGLTKQAGRAGLLHELARVSTPLATLRKWVKDEPRTLVMIKHAMRGMDPERKARWGDRKAGHGVTGEDVEALFEGMKPKDASEEGTLARLVSKLWVKGSQSCAEAPINLSLAAFEAFSDIWNAVKREGGHEALNAHPVPGMVPEKAPAPDKQRFAVNAAKRFEAVNQTIREWVKDPERMQAQAKKLGLERTSENAMPIIHALRGGGRLKTMQVARNCCEAGGPSMLTGATYGVYIENCILEGASFAERRVQIMTGSEGKVSNHSAIGRAGFLGQRLTQACAARTCVVEADCGAEPHTATLMSDELYDSDRRRELTGWALVSEEPIQLESGMTLRKGQILDERTLEELAASEKIQRIELDPLAPERPETLNMCVGATLARGATLVGGERWRKGRVLSADDVNKARMLNAKVTVRDLSDCRSKGGVCAACVGSLAARGRVPEVGTEMGVIAASSLNESITQPELNAFHLAGVLSSKNVNRRATCDGLMSGLSNPPWREPTGVPLTAKDPAPGSISEQAIEGRRKGGERGARRTLAKAIEDVATSGGVKRVDPTLLRVVAHALCTDDAVDLDRAAARGIARRYAASGLRPKNAARGLADPLASEWESRKERTQRLEHARSRDPEFQKNAHRAAARDDVATLRKLAEANPEALKTEDSIGWTPLHYAQSREAVNILMKAGCEPNAPARFDNRGRACGSEEQWRPTPLDLMTVKPISDRGMKDASLGERRMRTLNAMLNHMNVREARLKIESDPVLKRALKPLGPVARARAQSKKRYRHADAGRTLRAHHCEHEENQRWHANDDAGRGARSTQGKPGLEALERGIPGDPAHPHALTTRRGKVTRTLIGAGLLKDRDAARAIAQAIVGNEVATRQCRRTLARQRGTD